MAGSAQKWLLGCGIGCGLALLLVALLIGGGVYFFRDVADSFKGAGDRGLALQERFGEPGQYTPPPAGAVPPSRMEAFLAVRDTLASDRERFARTFASFEALQQHERSGRRDFAAVLHAVRGGLALAPLMGDFLERRNEALAAHDMGLGEYAYIYTLAYHVHLGHPASDGPRDVKVGDDEHLRNMRPRLRGALLSMLRNQLAAVEREAPRAGNAWVDSLRAEIAALQADPARLPWQDGLPPAIAASMAPHHERLAATYEPLSNPFELAWTARGGGRMEFNVGGEESESGDEN